MLQKSIGKSPVPNSENRLKKLNCLSKFAYAMMCEHKYTNIYVYIMALEIFGANLWITSVSGIPYM